MKRRTPVRELQVDENSSDASSLRRSTRIAQNSPVPSKVIERRSSANEGPLTPAKLTKTKRLSLSKDTEKEINTNTSSNGKSPTPTASDTKTPTRLRGRRSSITNDESKQVSSPAPVSTNRRRSLRSESKSPVGVKETEPAKPRTRRSSITDKTAQLEVIDENQPVTETKRKARPARRQSTTEMSQLDVIKETENEKVEKEKNGLEVISETPEKDEETSKKDAVKTLSPVVLLDKLPPVNLNRYKDKDKPPLSNEDKKSREKHSKAEELETNEHSIDTNRKSSEVQKASEEDSNLPNQESKESLDVENKDLPKSEEEIQIQSVKKESAISNDTINKPEETEENFEIDVVNITEAKIDAASKPEETSKELEKSTNVKEEYEESKNDSKITMEETPKKSQGESEKTGNDESKQVSSPAPVSTNTRRSLRLEEESEKAGILSEATNGKDVESSEKDTMNKSLSNLLQNQADMSIGSEGSFSLNLSLADGSSKEDILKATDAKDKIIENETLNKSGNSDKENSEIAEQESTPKSKPLSEKRTPLSSISDQEGNQSLLNKSKELSFYEPMDVDVTIADVSILNETIEKDEILQTSITSSSKKAESSENIENSESAKTDDEAQKSVANKTVEIEDVKMSENQAETHIKINLDEEIETPVKISSKDYKIDEIEITPATNDSTKTEVIDVENEIEANDKEIENKDSTLDKTEETEGDVTTKNEVEETGSIKEIEAKKDESKTGEDEPKKSTDTNSTEAEQIIILDDTIEEAKVQNKENSLEIQKSATETKADSGENKSENDAPADSIEIQKDASKNEDSGDKKSENNSPADSIEIQKDASKNEDSGDKRSQNDLSANSTEIQKDASKNEDSSDKKSENNSPTNSIEIQKDASKNEDSDDRRSENDSPADSIEIQKDTTETKADSVANKSENDSPIESIEMQKDSSKNEDSAENKSEKDSPADSTEIQKDASKNENSAENETESEEIRMDVLEDTIEVQEKTQDSAGEKSTEAEEVVEIDILDDTMEEVGSQNVTTEIKEDDSIETEETEITLKTKNVENKPDNDQVDQVENVVEPQKDTVEIKEKERRDSTEKEAAETKETEVAMEEIEVKSQQNETQGSRETEQVKSSVKELKTLSKIVADVNTTKKASSESVEETPESVQEPENKSKTSTPKVQIANIAVEDISDDDDEKEDEAPSDANNEDDDDDIEDETPQNEFIDDMAEEGEEDTLSEDSNEIVCEGESINSADTFSEDDSGEDNLSFIDDDDEASAELLSGEENFLQDIKDNKEKTKKTRRIVLRPVDDSSEDEKTQENESKEAENKVENAENSSDAEIAAVEKEVEDAKKEIEKVEEEIKKVEKEKNLSKDKIIILENIPIETIPETPGSVLPSTNDIISVDDSSSSSESDSSTSNEENQITPIISKNSNRKSSITIQENLKLDEIQDGELSDRISKVVDWFYTGLKGNESAGNISLNVSLDYAEPSPKTNEAEVKTEINDGSDVNLDKIEKKGSPQKEIFNIEDVPEISPSTSSKILKVKRKKIPNEREEVRKPKRKSDAMETVDSPKKSKYEGTPSKKKTRKEKTDASFQEKQEEILPPDSNKKYTKQKRKRQEQIDDKGPIIKKSKIKETAESPRPTKTSSKKESLVKQYMKKMKEPEIATTKQKKKIKELNKNAPPKTIATSAGDFELEVLPQIAVTKKETHKINKKKLKSKPKASPLKKIIFTRNVVVQDWETQDSDSPIKPSKHNKNYSKSKKGDILVGNPKDFRNQMLYDPKHVERIDTKTMLKRQRRR